MLRQMLFLILREGSERNALIQGIKGRNSSGVKVRQKNTSRALLNKIVIRECIFNGYS